MANQSKHTPGPWIVDIETYIQKDGGDELVLEVVRDNIKDNRTIAYVTGSQDDAALIAAAPETAAERDRLKEINSELLEALKECGGLFIDNPELIEKYTGTFEILNKAIAKAEGK